MDANISTRAALGSCASLGDLYDARRDDFCGISLFKKAIPEGALTLKDSPFSEVHLVHSDDFSGKFSRRDVKAELQVSVLGGLFKLEGSGKYLNDQKTSARTVKSSLMYNIKTKEESVNIYHQDLKDAFAIDAIESGVATHVVVGISWGANSVVSCLYENRENRDSTEIGGSLSGLLKKATLSISGKVDVDVKQAEESTGMKFDVKLFGDVLASDEELPTTVEGALNLMKKIPLLIRSSNNGKGKPITYRLIPLSLLQKYLNFATKADTMIKSLEEACLKRVVQLFDQMSAAQQQLNDFYQDALDHKYCVQPKDLKTISTMKDDMAIQETALRSNLATILINVRSGKSDVSELEKLIKNFQSSDISPENVSSTLNTWGALIEKIAFAKSLVHNGAKYIGLGSSLDTELLKDMGASCYVFYFTQQAKAEDPSTWVGNRQLFFQEMQKQDEAHKYYVVDCDIHPSLKITGFSSCIQVIRSGKIIVQNMLNEQSGKDIPVVNLISCTEKLLYKPNKRAPLAIACTGINCNPSQTYPWACAKCRDKLEYGFDQHVYCKCGKTPAICMEFKCTDPKHGIAFERHEETFLLQLLDSLRPFKETNILILGETGVGKSTWINGFINFLTYDTLQDAEKGELISLIPTEFSVCDHNYKRILVKTGTDKNEVFTAGQSATQGPKVYSFNINDTTIRLIDTPGIGDTRGIKQDKENFQNILGTLSYLKELHGICILLKPNSARLNVMFRFCIKELLTYLHRDASENIMFCFTNSRGTFYKPGDTLPALQILLGENEDVEIPLSRDTMYCYDSEAYRFLAAIKNDPPVTFSDTEVSSFAGSWEHSIAELNRMLAHIQGLKPHKIAHTLNLNNARQLVLKLSRPLAEISRTIQSNKATVQEEMKEIEKMQANIKALKAKQMVSRSEIQVTKIDHPRTVCGHKDCTALFGVGNLHSTKYNSICHDRCYVTGVTGDVIGHPNLMECEAFYQETGLCSQPNCGHHYGEHLHIWYDSAQVENLVEDQSVTESLKENLTAAEMKEKMIRDRTAEIEEYNEELQEIENASLKFACFLKANAIATYNDGIKRYLEHLIEEEENKCEDSAGRNTTTLKNLRLQLESYKKKKDILEQAMKNGDGSVSVAIGPEDVQKLIKRLQKMKHSGKFLKEALECVDYTKKNVYQHQVAPSTDAYGKRHCDNSRKEGRVVRFLKKIF